jgi:hypothetical protein
VPTFPPDPEPAQQDPLAALRTAYPGWMITPGMFGGFKATWRPESGLQIREIHGTSVANLHRRLEIIEAARADSE